MTGDRTSNAAAKRRRVAPALMERASRALGALRRLAVRPLNWSRAARPAAVAQPPARVLIAPPPKLLDSAPKPAEPAAKPAIPRAAPRKPAPQARARRDAAEELLSRAVTVEGVRIHAVERPGRDETQAIVLIHGAGLDHRDWTFDFFGRLAQARGLSSWRVIAFDRPGFGGSARPRGPAAALPASQARLLRAAAHAMGARRVVVAGHSWGGAVAMAWGLDAPESTIGVASLAGAVAPWSFSSTMRNGRRMQEAARTAMGEGGMRQAATDALTISFEPDAPPEGYLRHISTALSPISGPAAATMADVATINGALALMTPRYAAFERPVELVYGDADAILSAEEQGGAAAKLLPRARMTLLKGAGHMVHHAKPEDCIKALRRLCAVS